MKRYTRGEARDWWYERLRGGVRSPGRREGENLRALAADGVPVPEWLAWLEERGALRWRATRPGAAAARSAVVMELVQGRTLRELLAVEPPAARRAWLARLAALVARLHERGWYHRDLYLHQIAVRVDGREREVELEHEPELVLLDVGRARRERAPRRRWHVKDLAALVSSAPPAVTRAELLRALASYLEARGCAFARGERKRWARAVVHKARRIAAHAPRYVHAGSEVEGEVGGVGGEVGGEA